MQRPGKANEYTAWGASILTHAAAFVMAALTGLFTPPSAELHPRPVDVTVYDADVIWGDSGGGGGGGGEPAPAPEQPPSEDDVYLPREETSEPEREEYTESEETPPQKNEAPPAKVPGLGSNVNTAPGGKGTGGSGGGTGGGVGTGHGTGTGSGTGPGEGSGSGGGSGAGVGTGKGDGRDPEAAMRPKVPPGLISAVHPVYPEKLRHDGVEGVVRLRLLVDANGAVESVSVSESSGYDAMDAAAVDAAYGYSFSPAVNVYGDPVRCAITTSVRFRLN